MGHDDWGLPPEGDLDPDLTEEAGYADWEPPRRRVWPIILRVVGALLVAALVLPVVVQVLAD